jgi:hypothetical protein
MNSVTHWRHSKLVLGLFMVCLKAVEACSTSLPGPEASIPPSAAATPFEVIPVRGTLVEAGGVRGRLQSFRSPVPVTGATAELYVAGFPTEEFDAEITNVVVLDEGWYAADIRLTAPDARLEANTPFEGRLVARPIEKIACTEEPTP